MYSFVMPVFKARFLKNAIQSILNQRVNDFELIIVNDASPDPIDDVVKIFNDSRIRYYKNSENVGGKYLVKHWNKCIEYAKGDFIILASDDDEYDTDFLYEMNSLVEKYPEVNVFHSRVAIIDVNGKTTSFTAGCPEWESAEDFLLHRIYKSRVHFIPEFIFRRNALLGMGFLDFPAAWGSDNATVVQIASDNGVACVNQPLLKWRSSGINISTSMKYSELKFRGFCLYMQWVEEFLNANNSIYKDIIKSELNRFRSGRFADLLSSMSYFRLCVVFVSQKHEGYNVQRTLIIKAMLYKVYKRFFYAKVS